MNCLIVGGTSGLGLELARCLRSQEHRVTVWGRHDPREDGISFTPFDLTGKSPKQTVAEGQLSLSGRIEKALAPDMPLDRVIYAAGFFQKGKITDLTEDQIEDMLDVGGRGLLYLTRAILKRQAYLAYFAVIGSTSQWTPRPEEPVYNFTKAGAALYAEALAESGSISRTLVVGQSGMNTPFWAGTSKDTSGMLDPKWVAKGVLEELEQDDYRFKFIKVHRASENRPQHIERVKVTPCAT